MKTIEVYEMCERCYGTGLEWEDIYSWDCLECGGRGENLVSTRKEADMSNRNPNNNAETKEYIFYISGEIVVEDYSEEQAEEQMKESLRELVSDAVRDGSIEIK